MSSTTYFSPAFIEQMMQAQHPGKHIKVKQVQALAVDNSASILVALTAGQSESMIGHFGLTVSFEADGCIQTRNMVMKIKPHGDEIVAMLNSLATACGGTLAATYPAYKHLTGFQHTYMRELEVYKKLPSRLAPEIYGIYADQESNTYIILMEYLQEVALLNSVMHPEGWTDAYIRKALEQMAEWHAQHLNKKLPLEEAYWQEDSPSLAYMQTLVPLWEALLDNASVHHPGLYTPARVARLAKVIQDIPAYWQELESMPKTLVHNDMNPRNTCFKEQAGQQFCVYDWELATYHVPQYDVVELLCFVLNSNRYHLRYDYLEHYRKVLHALTGAFAEVDSFRRGFQLAAFDFGLHRLGMYMMAHTVSPYPFLERVANSYFNTLEQAEAYADNAFSNKAY